MLTDKELRQAPGKIRALRSGLAKSQAEFAGLVDVAKQTVSAWENGQYEPAAETFIRLGNLAPFPDNIWFWEAAGISRDNVLLAVERLQKDRTVAAGEMVRIPRMRLIGEAVDGPEFLVLPAEFAPKPMSTSFIRVAKLATGSAFDEGDFIAFDTSITSLKDVLGKFAVIDIRLDKKDRRGITNTWPSDGVYVGRVVAEYIMLDREKPGPHQYRYHAHFHRIDSDDPRETIFLDSWAQSTGPIDFGEEDVPAGIDPKPLTGCRILGRAIWCKWFAGGQRRR